MGGGAAGYAGGFISTFIQTGDLGKAHSAGIEGAKSGVLMGGAIGTTTGAYGGYKYAKSHNLDPWTGKSLAPPSPSPNNVDALINSASDTSVRQHGETQGFVQGDAQTIFQDLTKGAQHIRDNLYKLPDGTYINYHSSTVNGLPTIDINKGGHIYKIRVK